VLVEPVLANAGCVMPQPAYLQHLQDTARRHGALCSLDEVLMGFRLHPGLTSHLMGLQPDLATVGKAIGSGIAVAALLGRADIMVFPSRPQGEGMPGVLIEAGLSALPVVATDVPGVRSVVDGGTTGFIVDVDDLDGMVEALARLVEDPSLRTTMGEAARKRCVELFSIEVVATMWLRLLAPLLPPGVDTTA